MAAVFAVSTLICAAGWLVNHVSVKALVRYIKIKGYEPPTDEEIKSCVRWAALRMFKA